MSHYFSAQSAERVVRTIFQMVLSGALYQMLELAGVPVEGWLAAVLFFVTMFCHQLADDLGIPYPGKSYVGRLEERGVAFDSDDR